MSLALPFLRISVMRAAQSTCPTHIRFSQCHEFFIRNQVSTIKALEIYFNIIKKRVFYVNTGQLNTYCLF